MAQSGVAPVSNPSHIPQSRFGTVRSPLLCRFLTGTRGTSAPSRSSHLRHGLMLTADTKTCSVDDLHHGANTRVPGTLDLAILRTLQNDALGRVMKHA
jgi:hypothetical protein